jgi:hypothetical protein
MSLKSGRTRRGQLKPLEKRMSSKQMAYRAAKTAVRAQISRDHAITRGIAVSALQVLQRGFWGRLRWLLRGR